MARIELTGIAEPHRSTVTAIIDLARQGLFTDAQALLMIGRIRAAAGDPVIPPPRTGVAEPWNQDGERDDHPSG